MFDFDFFSILEYVAIAIVALVFLFSCIRTTPTRHYRAKFRLGKFVKIVEQGACFKWPFIESLSAPKTTQSEQHLIEVQSTTKDKVAVTLKLTIMTQVKPGKEEQAMFNLVDPEKQIESHVGKVVFAKVPSMDLDTLYSDTTGIIQAVSSDLEKFLDENGYTILGVNLNNIVLPPAVQESRDAVYEQTQRKLAATAEGETLVIKEVAKANAEKQSKKLQGEGVAAEREAIADGYARSIDTIGKALGLENASDEEKRQVRGEILAILNRQLEMDMMTKVGTTAKTVLMIPHNVGVTGQIAAGGVLSDAAKDA